MGKRKRSDNTGTSAEGAKRMKLQCVDDVLEKSSDKTKGNFIVPSNKSTNFHSNKLNIRMNQYVGISYQKLKKIMSADAGCGLLSMVEKRHITIGWHQLGEAAHVIKYILNSSLGQYRKSLNGILLAVGKIDIIDKPFCIADQPCMHIDLNVNYIVFRPKQGQTYKCLVTAVDKKFVTAKLYHTITFFANVKNGRKCPEVDDQVLIKFSSIEVKGPLYQIKGMIMSS